MLCVRSRQDEMERRGREETRWHKEVCELRALLTARRWLYHLRFCTVVVVPLLSCLAIKEERTKLSIIPHFQCSCECRDLRLVKIWRLSLSHIPSFLKQTTNIPNRLPDVCPPSVPRFRHPNTCNSLGREVATDLVPPSRLPRTLFSRLPIGFRTTNAATGCPFHHAELELSGSARPSSALFRCSISLLAAVIAGPLANKRPPLQRRPFVLTLAPLMFVTSGGVYIH